MIRTLNACAAVLVASSTLLAACSSSNLAWVFEFGDQTLADRAVIVEGQVRQGGCDGAVIWSARATRDSAADMSPPELAAGTYGLAGVAIDGDCVEFATGCVEITVPSGDETTTVTLTASAEDTMCPPEQCMDGTCSGMGDAAMDGAMDAPPDTPASDGALDGDTAVGDADADAADTAVMDTSVSCTGDGDCTGGTCVGGSCCFGCVAFGACVSGDDDGACGRGGGACDACTCPTDHCNAGTCEVGHPISALATSSTSTCAMSMGQLYCWGQNDYGQLALGAPSANHSTPQTASTSVAFDALADGDNMFAALEGGDLYAWGRNGDGQLGLGDTSDRWMPVRVGTDTTWTMVESGKGGDHTCGLRGTDLYCWGQGNYGQVGVGGLPPVVSTPTMIAGSWIDVALGHHFTCGIKSDGSLWCWGDNVLGQLGLGDAGMGTGRSTPTRVGSATDWTHVAAGDSHACGLRGAGTLWCWGQNDHGELGLGNRLTTIYTPTQAGTESDWVELEGGEDHTCGTRAGGSLWCWGINTSGQCGNGSSGGADVLDPTRMESATGWSQLDLGLDFGCVVDPDDALYCWGRNETGALGIGVTTVHRIMQAVCW